MTAGPASWDVVIAGAGPSGLAAATSCAALGMRVLVADPSLEEEWPATYGVWDDEVDLPPSCVATRWSSALVCTDTGGRRELHRPYAHLDGRLMAGWFRQRVAAAGGVCRAQAVRDVELQATGARVRLGNGESLSAAMVVDCTGGVRTLLEGSSGPPARSVAWQTAYGIFADVDEHPWAPGQMVLMDFRRVSSRLPCPSFLYAMPFSDRRVLLEETVLASVPEVPVEALEPLLYDRLQAMGIRVRNVAAIERVRIPMNAPLPLMPQPIVAFGAAAGFIHPATGYSVVRSLEQAPGFAEALARGLEREGPRLAAALAWQSIQPAELLRAQALARGGLEVLTRLTSRQLGAFMDGFFSMPEAHWRAFLSGTSPGHAIAGAMFRLGLHLPLDLLRRVVALALGEGRAHLLDGLVPGRHGADA